MFSVVDGRRETGEAVGFAASFHTADLHLSRDESPSLRAAVELCRGSNTR